MAKKKYQNFEIMTMQPEPLIEELKREIEGNGSIKYIKELLHWGHFDVNVIWKNERGTEWTFLMKASVLNKPKIVRILLEEGADPNVQDAYGLTALGMVFRANRVDLEIIQELLSHPSTDPNVLNNDDISLFHWASMNGHSQVVKAILKHPSFDPNVQDKSGYTGLRWASIYGRSQVVEEILKHPKIDPNNGGVAALIEASIRDHSQVVEALLKHPQTDPNVQNNGGDTALHGASRYGYSQVVEAFLKHPSTDPNIQKADGSTALIEASSGGRSQVVEELLKHPKIYPNVQNEDGNTALILISKKGISQGVRLLLKHPNIDLTIENNEGFNAWDIAPSHIREKFPELNPNNIKAIDKTFEDKIMLLKTICEGLCNKLSVEDQKDFKKILDQI